MKRVKAIVGIQGADWSIDAGEVQDWGDDRAEFYIRSGDVELVEDLNPQKPKVVEEPKAKRSKAKK